MSARTVHLLPFAGDWTGGARGDKADHKLYSIMNWNRKMDVRDSNGTILVEGDNVTLIKDLKVKGTSETLKRGTMIKGIHLTDDPQEVECRHAKIKGLVLRTEFLKKA